MEGTSNGQSQRLMRLISNTTVWTDIPRTGTTTIIETLRKSGIPVREIDSHKPGDDYRYPHAMISVRHPVLWLRSLYARSVNHGVMRQFEPMEGLYQVYGEDLRVWHVFMMATTSCAGVIDGFGEYWTGQTRSDAHLIRNESIIADLDAAMVRCGIPTPIQSIPDQNVSSDLPIIDPEWARDIYALNPKIYKAWGYDWDYKQYEPEPESSQPRER